MRRSDSPPYVAWVAVVAIAILAAAAWLSRESDEVLRAADAWVQHSREVQLSLERLLSGARDAETGQRGFLITRQEPYLDPYRAALPVIAEQTRRLEALLADDPEQRERLRALEPVLAERLLRLAEAVEASRASPDAAFDTITSGTGKVLMDRLRDGVAEMERAEEARLLQRQADVARARRVNAAVDAVSAALAVALVLAMLAVSRAAARRLAHSERRLKVIFESIGDAVIATDGNGRVERMNPVAEALTGWPGSEAVQRPLEAVFRIVNEQSREPVESPVQKVMRMGGVVGLANHTLLIARDGRETPIEDSASPIGDERRGAEGIVLVFRDASEARAVEHERACSEARFRTLADGMPQIVYVSDESGRIEYLNRRWFDYTGQDGAAPPGTEETIHADDREALDIAWRNARAHQTPLDAQFRLRARDGSFRWFLTRAVPLREAGSGRLQWYGTSTDIDEAFRAREALAEADRRKDEFLATLAHELRNPLAPMRTAVHLLQDAGVDETRRAWAAGVIERQVHTMSGLLEDLLELSRITRGAVPLDPRWVSLAEVVDAAIEQAQPLIDARRHVLRVTRESLDVSLEADPLRLTQVLANLLTNAAKYTEPGGRITLAASARGGQVEIAVHDTGVGLAPADLARVFEMFTQVDRQGGGLGIGLALVRRLVGLHGGTVSAASEGPGRGCTFTVTLPLGTAARGAADPPAPAASRTAPSRPLRVLVADDNGDAARSLAMWLEMLGHEVELAFDGEDALAKAVRSPPDVALIDIGMPRLNGHEVARRLRAARPPGTGPLLVALTGWGQDGDRALTREAGFDHHWVKPVDPDAVVQLLAEVAERAERGDRAAAAVAGSADGAGSHG